MQNLELSKIAMDEIVKDMAEKLQRSIDFNILADIYKADGWVEINFNPWMQHDRMNEVKVWLDKNCRGNHTSMDDRFLFQLEEDAVNFTLKFL